MAPSPPPRRGRAKKAQPGEDACYVLWATTSLPPGVAGDPHTFAGPYATLDEARAAARTLTPDHGYPSDAVEIQELCVGVEKVDATKLYAAVRKHGAFIEAVKREPQARKTG